MIDLLNLLSTVAVGLFTGSLLIEGMVLAPYWRSMTPESFFRLHSEFGPRLFRYFAPLTTAAFALPAITAALGFFVSSGHNFWTWLAAGLLAVVTATFPLYFRAANQRFADRSLTDDALRTELSRWSRVHIFRTILALGAFLACVISNGG